MTTNPMLYGSFMPKSHEGVKYIIPQLKAELEQLKLWHRAVCSDLESIFNRVEDGLPAELHYPDGRVFIVEGKERE